LVLPPVKTVFGRVQEGAPHTQRNGCVAVFHPAEWVQFRSLAQSANTEVPVQWVKQKAARRRRAESLAA
jgi:hypothetical protein